MKTRITWTWTNWTFGIWSGRFGHTKQLRWGIDLGPLEIVRIAPKR
jgi:hypothetical protein